MTLKEVKKKYQGKYFKSNYRYYRFVKISESIDPICCFVHTECVDTFFGSIDNNKAIIVRFDDETHFDNEFRKITKGEFIKQYNKVNQQILNRTIGVTIPDIKIDSCKINDFIYYKPADFDIHDYFTLDGDSTSITYWPDYIR